MMKVFIIIASLSILSVIPGVDACTCIAAPDYDEIVKDLIESVDSDELFSERYRETWVSRQGLNGPVNKIFHDVPESVEIQTYNYIAVAYCAYDDPELIHFNRQQRDFNIRFCLNPARELDAELEDVFRPRAIARVVADIGKYALNKEIPLCFPFSGGFQDSRDYSQIVYYP